MTTVTINERTIKGKSLLEYLRKFEGEHFINIEEKPSASLLKSIEEVRIGKTKEMKNTAEYFKKLRKRANV
jgi:hypothetical protein